MPTLTIDGHEITVPEGMTVLQAATLLGIEIPVFCYHPKLSIAGNCRMCLVEEAHHPKPVASCAMPVCEGMVINTQAPAVKKARHSVLEMLLINHPLDCPVCDQGGECDLQDIAVAYGGGKSRYALPKRQVANKDLGPLIATVMNRCIQCTRCIRFATEIAGVPELGAVGRGEDMEITTYLEHALTSELSGNLIDVCPVGALISKPNRNRIRSWELAHTPSIDVHDAVGSAIRIDTCGTEVMRILPRQNDEINESWISDKVRFAYDALKYQRLERPYVRNAKGKLVPTTWDKALSRIDEGVNLLKRNQIAAIAGDLMDAEAMVVLKDLITALGSPHIDCRQDGEKVGMGPRCSYLFNTTIAGIEQADFCLLIGCNPRLEAPLVQARLRKTNMPVGVIGPDQGFGTHYGNDPLILEKILKGNHPLTQRLKQAKYPMMIVGGGVLQRADGATLLHVARAIADKYGFIHHEVPADHWNGFNVLHTAASRVGGLDLGFLPGPKGLDTHHILRSAKIKAVYLLGVDEIDMRLLKSKFVIYQGHHGDRGAAIADVVLPGAAYAEKSGTYVNTEGRVQRTLQALMPPGEAREDWRILCDLAAKLGVSLPYNTLVEVRQRLVAVNAIFEELDTPQRAEWLPFGEPGTLLAEPFKDTIESFYATDSITRHSPTLAQCRALQEARDAA